MTFFKTNLVISKFNRIVKIFRDTTYYTILMCIVDLIAIICATYIYHNSAKFEILPSNIISTEYLWVLVGVIILKYLIRLYFPKSVSRLGKTMSITTNIVITICSMLLTNISYGVMQLKSNYIDSISLNSGFTLVRIWNKEELKEYLYKKLLKDSNILEKLHNLKIKLPLPEKLISNLLTSSSNIADLNGAVINFIEMVIATKELLEKEQAEKMKREMTEILNDKTENIANGNFWTVVGILVGGAIVIYTGMVIYSKFFDNPDNNSDDDNNPDYKNPESSISNNSVHNPTTTIETTTIEITNIEAPTGENVNTEVEDSVQNSATTIETTIGETTTGETTTGETTGETTVETTLDTTPIEQEIKELRDMSNYIYIKCAKLEDNTHKKFSDHERALNHINNKINVSSANLSENLELLEDKMVKSDKFSASFYRLFDSFKKRVDKVVSADDNSVDSENINLASLNNSNKRLESTVTSIRDELLKTNKEVEALSKNVLEISNTNMNKLETLLETGSDESTQETSMSDIETLIRSESFKEMVREIVQEVINQNS